MKKTPVLIILLLIHVAAAFATHQRAAEITYNHIEGLTYEFTVVMFTRTSSPADDTRGVMPIYWGDGTGDEIPRIIWEELAGVEDISYNLYKGTHTFPAPGKYVISVEDPNRNTGVQNIPNSINVPMFIESELTINPFLGYNNSVQLLNPPIDNGCVGKLFIHNPGAYDVDGDSLSYRLVVCKGAGGFDIPGYSYPKTSQIFEIDEITGDLRWETPIIQGEYNVAFVIDEWRFGINIGSVRRDMQINILACDHEPPEIISVSDTCVVAGDFLTFDVLAYDPDGTGVELSAVGGPFEQSVNKAFMLPNNPTSSNDTVFASFNWQTVCSHVKVNPYTVLFKATDNGSPANLVNFKSVAIKVIAPAPENLQVEALGNGVNLSWEKSFCDHNMGYRIYRRSGPSGWEHGYCETGVPLYTGFRLISELQGANTLSYRDDNGGLGLTHGIDYCYRVTAFFYDNAESYASNEDCAYLKRDVPIITNVSNDSLDLIQGIVNLVWSKPIELDTIQYPGPYNYLLYRNDGILWDAPLLIKTFNHLNDTIYYDAAVNLNTSGMPFNYQVDLESETVGYIGSSSKAASLFLRTEPRDRETRLIWLPKVPWENEKYVVYRKAPGTSQFDSIGSSELLFYRDRGLVNGQEYCYYIKSIGHYSLPGLLDPLINFSQISCEVPEDVLPPCEPVLSVQTHCDSLVNRLSWTLPYDSCNYDVAKYYVYFTALQNMELELIDSLTNPYDTIFYHFNDSNYVGCYAVKAIDSVGNISDFSNIVCINYDACPDAIYALPNVFTPNNGDDFNPLFVPRVNHMVDHVDMSIFNRWGNIVYETTDPEIRWDGKHYKNKLDCAEGVYYYVCQVYFNTIEGLRTMTLKGSVTIIRGRSGR